MIDKKNLMHILLGIVVVSMIVIVGIIVVTNLKSSIKPVSEMFYVSDVNKNQIFYTEYPVYSVKSVMILYNQHMYYFIDKDLVIYDENEVVIPSELLKNGTVAVQIEYIPSYTFIS